MNLAPDYQGAVSTRKPTTYVGLLLQRTRNGEPRFRCQMVTKRYNV